MPLGMVINGTNTERYYDSREISNSSIEYKKLPSSGRSFVECESLVKTFIKTVDDFLESNNDNNLLIGVHCTDGVNRAGYLICRYMIDRLGMSINDALNAFETSRGYNIERGALVQALYRADRTRKMRNNRNGESEEEEVDLTERERRKRKRRQKETVDDSFDPHTMQEIQSLVKTIKQMQAEPPAAISQDFTQISMNSKLMNNSAATTITYQNYQQSRATPQQHLVRNASENSSPYLDSQEVEDEDESDGDDTPIDMAMLGRIDVKELTTAQRRRMRRKKLKKQFDVMKRGRIWEINEHLGN
jgi:atypical dual specificity phosphatase